MTCKQVEARLLDYLDGSLPPHEQTEVDLHARACASCEERIQGFTGVFDLLDSWKGIEPSSSFDLRLERRINQEASGLSWWARLLPRPLANPVFAFALMLVISVGTMLVRYSPAVPAQLAEQQPDPFGELDDLNLYQNLPVLEDLDVLRNFEVLQVLDGEKQ